MNHTTTPQKNKDHANHVSAKSTEIVYPFGYSKSDVI